MRKVKSEDNTADILTKFVGSDTLSKHLYNVGLWGPQQFHTSECSSQHRLLNNRCTVHTCLFYHLTAGVVTSFRVDTSAMDRPCLYDRYIFSKHLLGATFACELAHVSNSVLGFGTCCGHLHFEVYRNLRPSAFTSMAHRAYKTLHPQMMVWHWSRWMSSFLQHRRSLRTTPRCWSRLQWSSTTSWQQLLQQSRIRCKRSRATCDALHWVLSACCTASWTSWAASAGWYTRAMTAQLTRAHSLCTSSAYRQQNCFRRFMRRRLQFSTAGTSDRFYSCARSVHGTWHLQNGRLGTKTTSWLGTSSFSTSLPPLRRYWTQRISLTGSMQVSRWLWATIHTLQRRPSRSRWRQWSLSTLFNMEYSWWEAARAWYPDRLGTATKACRRLTALWFCHNTKDTSCSTKRRSGATVLEYIKYILPQWHTVIRGTIGPTAKDIDV